MFGIRLLNRSAIASTSTPIACTSSAARWTSQRHFSLTRILKEEKSNESTNSSQSSTGTNKEAEIASAQWRDVGRLAQDTTTEDIRSLNEKSMQLWRNALKSVGAPPSQSPLSVRSFEQAARKRTHLEEMEHQWKNRKILGPDRNAIPSDGRSVPVRQDLSRAMANLNSIFRVNNIRTELRLGERYEKPNQKRRRLASERHRRRFAHMVREKVQLIMYLKSRGA
ncbi:uncharacterized protein FA14DRAFT_186976 [Meira miltonrushii]|uniref:Ribosomal protein S21 n=1 Tax=Meira miltonrushii TaxID=1280837 RepID=A0A316VIC7_9BASI|nr:uncharacterized protein FA14DRAFT_186976 [Meira miltonrushii]PWN36798.1 hypothetical protein FA14DRAFT_186976 [Meira miltonrushii]